MKTNYTLFSIISSIACLLMTGCDKNSGTVWDDDKTSGNYKGSARALWGNDGAGPDGLLAPSSDDFLALNDDDLRTAFSDGAIPQPKHDPGEAGSGLPGIEGFLRAKGLEASIFKTLYFNTDDHILRGQESLAALDAIADYLKSHSNVYIFIEGHCDERAPEQYNLSLGARRANYVRSTLVEKGVDLEKIHTVSYGKERPAEYGHSADAWSKNRRAEFKIYKK